METLQNQIIKEVVNNLHNKLETLVIEGLKRKGFEFNTQIELETFLKERCKRIDNLKLKEHIYYVENIPFFLHKYEITFNPNIEYGNSIKMTTNYGEYCFL